MAKTLVEKLDSPDLDVTIFKISGTLGFHENQVLTKFFNECAVRGIAKLVMDFSELGSLGGGCAKIIRDAAASDHLRICIAGASKTVQGFLERRGSTALLFAPDTAAAVSLFGGDTLDAAPTEVQSAKVPPPAPDQPRPERTHVQTPTRPVPEYGPGTVDDIIADVDSVLDRSSRVTVAEPESPTPGVERAQPERPTAGDRWASAPTERAAQNQTSTSQRETPAQIRNARSAPARATDAGSGPSDSAAGAESSVKAAQNAESERSAAIKELKRTLVQYKWLFSLNEDFSALEDKQQLLDAFLLTTIAQIGVEAAAFLESSGDGFVATCWKGFETAEPSALNIARGDVDLEKWVQSPRIFPLEEAPFSDDVKQRLDGWDLPHAAPFVVHDKFRGIVLLGRAIRQELDERSWEFLSMMITQVAIAYENSCRLEQETERTLGLVQSLISMVESNTLSRGTTELVMDLTYAVAVKMHYPDGHIRDLMYGTVLRDIGMIKTSDLILRSPRELMQEEWEVIKKHPIEGSEMLERMRFSEHTREIVMYHHERYNGEGYPRGLAGPQIPLGARILSVVESYAAMLQDRPTRSALSREEALSTLKENWGLRYDPEVVNVFIDVIEEEIRTGETQRYKGIDLIRD